MKSDLGQAFSNRSIDRLDHQIKSCREKQHLLLLFAKKAAYLARLSCLEEARSIVTDLRTENSGYDPQLSGWIMFAEGLILHFDSLDNAKTKDKFQRAFLVSQMAGDRELAGMSAAWMAHCELMDGQMKGVAEHIAKAFEWSDPDGSETRGRASLVLADTLNWAGEIDLARYWYREARAHAVQDGDIAMQNVVLHNAAALGVWHLTLKDCASSTDAAERQRASMDAASATNLNAALGIDSLSTLLPIMRAELLVVQERWREALDLIEQHVDGLVREGQKRLRPKILAQRAWCKANCGDAVGATADIEEALGQLDACADFDDLYVLHFRISAAAGLLGDRDIATRHQAFAFENLRLFQEQQAETRNLLKPLLNMYNPQGKDPA